MSTLSHVLTISDLSRGPGRDVPASPHHNWRLTPYFAPILQPPMLFNPGFRDGCIPRPDGPALWGERWWSDLFSLSYHQRTLKIQRP